MSDMGDDEWTGGVGETAYVAGMHTGAGRHTILVEGDVEISTAPRLQADLRTALQSDAREVVVDLRDVTFIDSTGLGVLVNARQRARTDGKHLKLMLPEGEARFPFEVTGLASLFDTSSSVSGLSEHRPQE